MGRALADRYAVAARTFDEASDTLGSDIRALCWSSSQDELDRTASAQPAILTASIAALRAAHEMGLAAHATICLGHSLGEFTALVAAGGLAFPDALRLVRRRGELMQQAADAVGGGAMAAVLGLDASAVEAAIAGTGAVLANDNAPGQAVISGPRDAIDRASDALRHAGAKRVLPLRVSGAFHSQAMRAVAPELRSAIDATALHALRSPVIANVDAVPHDDVRDFPSLLERQVWSPVRWVASVGRAQHEGASLFIEFGAGNVLTGLVKRIVPGAATANVSDPSTLEAALGAAGGQP